MTEERRKEWPADGASVKCIPGPPYGTWQLPETVTVCDCPAEGQVWVDTMFAWGYCPECGHSTQISNDKIREYKSC